MPRKISSTILPTDNEIEKILKTSRLYSKETIRLRPGSIITISRAIIPEWFWEHVPPDNTYNVKFLVGRFGQLIWWGQEKSIYRPYFDGVDFCKDESHHKNCICLYYDVKKYTRVDPERKMHYIPSLIPLKGGGSIPGFYQTPAPNTFYILKFLIDWGIPVNVAVNLKVRDLYLDADPPYIDMSRLYTEYKKIVSREIGSYWRSYITTMHYNNYPQSKKSKKGIGVNELFYTERFKKWTAHMLQMRFRKIISASGVRDTISLNSLALYHAKKLYWHTRDIDFTNQQSCATMRILKEWREKLPPMETERLDGLKFDPNTLFSDTSFNITNIGVGHMK